MQNEQNPYQAYTDGSVFSENPLSLVVALYQGALEATQRAERALAEGDIMGRSKAINKALAIIWELMGSLDHQRGGEISRNLDRLYTYMQGQLLAAHTRQMAEPMAEVAGLLSNLLEGWRKAGQSSAALERAVEFTPAAFKPAAAAAASQHSAPFYGGYMDESAAGQLSTAYSF